MSNKSYRKFKTLDAVRQQFNLTWHEESDLFAAVDEVAASAQLQNLLSDQLPLALAISTEKARSELIVMPILMELWRLTHGRIGLFSGVEFNVDAKSGLMGVCDFIITRTAHQFLINQPIVVMVEAKNDDMKGGLPQCVAEMVAAQKFNAREGKEDTTVFGVVTTGNQWKFLQLKNATITIDQRDYYIVELNKITGILLHLVS